MRSSIHLLLLIALLLPTVAMSQSPVTYCPSILDSTNADIKYSKVQLTEMVEHLEAIKKQPSNGDKEIEVTQIIPEDPSIFKISIEQVDATTNKTISKMSIDCPYATQWTIRTVPSVTLLKPKSVKDLQDPVLTGEKTSLIRKGLRLTRFFSDSKEFFSITMLWNLFSEKSKEPLGLPSFIDSENLNQDAFSVANVTYPVRGVRFSTTGKFGNVWYLATKKALIGLANKDFLSPTPNENLDDSFTEITARNASTSFLDYYDSVNKKIFQCSDILAREKDGNCLHYNYQLNPDLWDRVEKGDPVWFQIIVELNSGYLLQTYKLSGNDLSTPELVEQKFEANLNKYNIPATILN